MSSLFPGQVTERTDTGALDRRLDCARGALMKDLGGSLRILDVERHVRRPYSEVVFLRAQAGDLSRRYVMKTTVCHPVNEMINEAANQAQVEYDVMKRLHPVFQTVPRCAVPRAIAVWPEIDSCLMERMDGHVLMQDFRYTRWFSSIRHLALLDMHMEDAGRWLRILQQEHCSERPGCDGLAGVVSRLEHRLKLIETLWNGRSPADFADRVNDLVRRQLDMLGEGLVPVSGRHGDFTPLNMLGDDAGLTVIDFMGYENEDPVAVDVLKMLVFFENEGRALTSSPRRVERLRRAFLRGYGDLPPTSRPALVVCEAMQRVVSIWGHLAHVQSYSHHRLEARRCLNVHLRWLLAADPPLLLDKD